MPQLQETQRMLHYDDSSSHVAEMKEQGYTVLPSLLDRAFAGELREEVLEIIRETQPPHPQLQQSSQYLIGSRLDRLVGSEELRRLASELCEGECLRFLPFTAVKAPGGGGFQYHQDNQYRLFDGLGVNLWLALEDIDEQNGCLCLVPGSHKLGPLDWVPTGDPNKSRTITWEPDNAVPIRMRAGDCLAFDRLTIHCSLANRTEQPRVGYSVTYHLADVRFFDDGEWKPLRTQSRWRTMPIEKLHRFSDLTPGGHR
jgi:phytanoyl-CoA hydroxylase